MITHKPLHSAWWYFARTCTLTTARTLLNFKIIGQRSRWIFVSGPKFTTLYLSNVEKIVVDNAVFRSSIAWSVPDIFAIKVQSCPKSSALLITHEPLHPAWWNLHARVLRQPLEPCWISRSSVKGQGHVVFLFFCVHDAVTIPADST